MEFRISERSIWNRVPIVWRLFVSLAGAMGILFLLFNLITPLPVRGQTGCVDDRYEPNDNAAEAPLLPVGTYENLVICPNNSDWFKIQVDRDTRITLDLLFTNARGDLDLHLMASATREVASSISQTDNEHLVYTTTEPATLYIYIKGYRGASNTYTLIYQTKKVDDAYEPNDNLVEAPLLTPGIYPNLIIAPNDPDFFRLNLPAQSIITAAITFSNTRGNLDLYLVNGQGRPLQYSTSNSSDIERVIYGSPSQGPVYLYITGYQGATNTYTLTLEVQQVGPCHDDPEAPNQSKNQAREITPGQLRLMLCPGKEDWFRTSVPGFGVLQVTITFQHMLGDLDLFLWNGRGSARLAKSTGVGDREKVTYTFEDSSRPYIQVKGYGVTLRSPYTMDVAWATFTPTPTMTPTPTSTPTPTPTLTATSTPTVTPSPTAPPTPTGTPTPTPSPTSTPARIYLPWMDVPGP